jgi:integrase
VFYNALGYAVEQGHLASNPVDRIQWTTPAVAASVDRRVVVSPAQARDLLAAVRGLSERGQHLEAFFACLYYAALRPSEAVMLREGDLYLPMKGWGEDRPGRLRLPGRHGLDRRRHRQAGARTEAPRRQRDPHHPHPARTRPPAARPHQAGRHHS